MLDFRRAKNVLMNKLLLKDDKACVFKLSHGCHIRGENSMNLDEMYYLILPFYLFIFNIFIYLFIYLFMAVMGLRCCAWAFCSCGKRGLLFVVVRRLLIVVASLVVEHGL